MAVLLQMMAIANIYILINLGIYRHKNRNRMLETILFLICLGISKVVVDFAEKAIEKIKK